MAERALEIATVELSTDLRSFIDEWRDREGNLIMILHRTQEEYGYISREIALALARYLQVPLAKIYGVITFYHFFKTKQPGKNRIQVCMGTACYLKGAQDLIDEFSNLLDIEVNETGEDMLFNLEAVRCVGCCGLAPVVTVNGEVYGKKKPADLDAIVAEWLKLSTESTKS